MSLVSDTVYLFLHERKTYMLQISRFVRTVEIPSLTSILSIILKGKMAIGISKWIELLKLYS